MKKIVTLSLLASSLLLASGYQIPETSTNAVALGSANVAHNHGADSAYYNPANMSFMENSSFIETDLTYIHLSEVNYKDSTTDIDSKGENFFIPTLHYVSNDIEGYRFGFAMVSPAGLSKRWSDAPASLSAEEFTLKTLEFNPTVSKKLQDNLSVAFGFRGIYSEGIVKNAYYHIEGDGFDFGYNLAVSYKPKKDLELSATYRSMVDLHLKGNAKEKGDVKVSVPIPATLNLAVAYTLPSKTTFEFVYERTYWSTYDILDFDFSDATNEAIYGQPIVKDWDDSDTYRLGITQIMDEKLTLMGGFVYDYSPVPKRTLGYELPDTQTTAISFGGRYKLDSKAEVALSTLYSFHSDRDSETGEFSRGDVLMVSAGVTYKF